MPEWQRTVVVGGVAAAVVVAAAIVVAVDGAAVAAIVAAVVAVVMFLLLLLFTHSTLIVPSTNVDYLVLTEPGLQQFHAHAMNVPTVGLHPALVGVVYSYRFQRYFFPILYFSMKYFAFSKS